MLAEQNRTFGYAVAASIALHALALTTQGPPMRPVAPTLPEPPLVAHLAEPAPPPPAPPPPLERPAEPELKAKPAPRPKPKPKPRPRPAPVARPSLPLAAPPPPAPPPPAPAALPPEPPQRAAAQPQPVAPEGRPPSAPPAAVVAAPPRPDPAVAMAQFRERLVELAGRYKRYPRRAADNGWTGEVVVRIDIGANGKVESVRVKKSSGFAVLDAQALEMFNRAAPAVALPPALRGKAFSVEVRAIYNFSDRPS